MKEDAGPEAFASNRQTGQNDSSDKYLDHIQPSHAISEVDHEEKARTPEDQKDPVGIECTELLNEDPSEKQFFEKREADSDREHEQD